VVDGEVAGQIMFYPLKAGGNMMLILAPMCVKPSLQRKGIGGQLILKGLKKAAESGYDSVIVVGHPGYYPRFGFEKASKWGIKLPFEVPDEAFMAIELKKGSLEGKQGTINLPQPYVECG
jgi:predicted N-acetyltransferase YhbS